MKSRKFNTIYVNGCSHTAGHSLEVEQAIEKYVQKYNIEPWKNEREVIFPKRLSDYYKCDLVDDSQCGSGSPRVVRKTFEYIQKVGVERAKKTLFILLLNTPIHRLEYYCKEINDYLIVNVQYNDDGTFKYINAVEKFSKTDRKYDPDFFKGKILGDIKLWLNEYHDPIVYMEKINDEILGLFSFLELNNIEYFYGFDTGAPSRKFNNDRKININDCQTIYEYVNKYHLTLHHELEDGSGDFHPGYFGHLKFAKDLIKFINYKLTPNLWTFGDSFTQTFTTHFNTTNQWAVKYRNYTENNPPKSYNEHISEYFGFNLRNQGMGGSCNANIFSNIIQNIKNGNIKDNDVVIINWTHNRRFRLADNFNLFSDVIEPEHHLSPNDDVSQITNQEISLNRSYYSVYYNELIEYMTILKEILKNNIIYFWTWSEPIQTMFNFKSQLNDRYILIGYNWNKSNELNKQIFHENVDYSFYDKDIKIEDLENGGRLKKLIDDKKIVGIITNNLHSDLNQEIQNKLNSIGRQTFDTTDLISEFKKNILPFKKYTTIKEETNGEIDDLHYGKQGHIDLSNDIISLLNKTYIKFND